MCRMYVIIWLIVVPCLFCLQFFYDQEESPYYLIQTSAQQIIRDPKLFTITPAAKVEEKKKDEKKNEVGI
jgi:hypothetical protein